VGVYVCACVRRQAAAGRGVLDNKDTKYIAQDESQEKVF
jgi:hypothetical protein